MKLVCLGSSSSGNCYVLSSDSEAIIIEAGVDFKSVKRTLNFNTSKVSACIVSHRHNDHSKYLQKYVRSGIRVLALQDVLEYHDIAGSTFCTTIEPMHGYVAGGFKILTLRVSHDVPCVGFLIEHKELGRLLFMTDTMMFEYKFPTGINHVMIEANYADDILNYNIENGIVPAAMRSRLMHTHMEIGTTRSILTSNDTKDVLDIILLHLSCYNSDSERFKNDITAATGKQVYVAGRGFEIELSNKPY